MSKLKILEKDIQKLADQIQAKNLARFFQTQKGGYGEGDKFLGIKVPLQRKIVSKYYQELSLREVQELLKSKYHECRLIALLVLVRQHEKGNDELKKKIFDLYLQNTKYINNWDLVDLSAPNIIGNYLLNKNRKILYKLAKSKSLWERRIAMLATAAFIHNNEYQEALKISEILLQDKHDLIHKAVGWMLREVGNRDKKVEIQFLDKYYHAMPRTMLRYAIEKFPESKRKYYLKKKNEKTQIKKS